MNFEVKILGCNSAIAQHGRHPTAQVFTINEKPYLIDCGEGTQMRMNDFKVKRFKIDQIFISHLHGDHYYGLIGLITSFNLLGRTNKLTIYGPESLQQIIDLQIKGGGTKLNYPIDFFATQANEKELIFENDFLSVHSFPLKHRVPTTGFLFKEKNDLRKINGSAIKAYKLDSQMYQALREGNDITDKLGHKIKNELVTFPPAPPRIYAYCSDTAYFPEIVPHIQNADLLYHETTFMADGEKRAAETMHSTTLDAANIANQAGVKKMLIGHFSSKYIQLNDLLNETRTHFSNTDLAVEGETFRIDRQI